MLMFASYTCTNSFTLELKSNSAHAPQTVPSLVIGLTHSLNEGSKSHLRHWPPIIDKFSSLKLAEELLPVIGFPVKPMLLETRSKPFDSKDYLFEWKVDGIRLLMFYSDKAIRLQSRTGRDCTSAFFELVPEISAQEAVLDGEVTVLTNGRPDFEAVMQRYLANPDRAKNMARKTPASYVVWDILWNDGKSTMGLPLTTRKQILAGILEDKNGISKIDWVDQKGIDLWHSIKELKLEGMVAKKKNSYYTPGRRSAAWIKIKNYQELVVNVFGYSKKDGGILVGGDRIQGHAIGMNTDERTVLKELLDRYGKVERQAVYLPPGIKGRVKFTTWTAKGNMRDCSWVGFELI